MSGRARSPALFLAAALVAIPLIIATGLATDFEVKPESITPASPFSIGLYNVSDGASLNITATPSFIAPFGTSWCNFTNWRYSFALGKGNVTVIGENTNRIQLHVRAGKVYQMSQKTGTGDITVTMPLEYLPDVYYDFRILYEVHDMKQPVRISLVQQGAKSGPAESVSTPNLYGISEGTLAIQVRENGQLLGSDEILIGPPITGTTTAPTQVPTAAPNGTPATTVPTTQDTTAAVTTAPTPPATTRPPVTRPVTPPATTPAATPAPGPEAGGVSPVILVYAAVIIIIAIIADYFILKD